MPKAEIIEVKLSDIKLNPNNPRLIKDDKFKKLVNSIKEFPQMLKIRPIVVNSDMIILGGNMRYKACKEAGLKEVSIIVADNLTEDQQREFLIKDNVSGGEWDWEVLSNEWDTEKLEEWGLDIPTFDINGETDSEGNFDDPGISDKNQFGVIVVCESAGTQESVFNDLTKMGFNCKIVVT
jgi:ParB-like chromosome segregation protein Spo0J